MIQEINLQIEEIVKKIRAIENILTQYTATSWDEYRHDKSGVFNAYSFDELKDQKKLLQQKENILLQAKHTSPAGK